MKRIFLATSIFFLSLALCFSAQAKDVGGLIMDDEAWTKADSPIVVTSNVTVIEGVTLTIEPGVEVRFNQDMALFIDGTLIARGTSDEKITFTSNGAQEPGYWGYIFFSDTSTDATFDVDGNYTGGCILQYATVQYGGSGREAIVLNLSSPFIDNSVIADNDSGGISVIKNSPVISNCEIKDNSGSGISFAGDVSSTLTVKDSTISENSVTGSGAMYYSYGGGIYASGGIVNIQNTTISGNSLYGRGHGGGIYAEFGTVNIENSTISGNDGGYYGGGIYAKSSTVTIQNSTISGNYASYYAGGIQAGRVTIQNSTISGNSTPYWVGGIYASGTVTIQNSIISGNSTDDGNGGGIYASGTVTIKGTRITQNTGSFGVKLSGLQSGSVIGGTAEDANVIKDNIGDGVYISGNPVFNYNDVYNNTGYELVCGNASDAPDFDATNNYWGTTNEFAIKAEIYDGFDDATLGFVNYIPFLTEPIKHDDVTPPAAVTNLATSNPTANSITLTWTAPGDDGDEGQAKTYDIRYSTSEITDANWDDATQCMGEPPPKPAGEPEEFTVTGLSPDTTYYFAMKTADEVPNWSDLSNVATGTTSSEAVPPATVTDLAIFTLTGNSVTLKWTAPGGDGDVGTAAEYDIRYSTSEITGAHWDAATQCTGEPAPQPAGSEETFTVTGLEEVLSAPALSPLTIHYFALKTADEVPNWSDLSNVAVGKTTAKTGDVSGDGTVSAHDAALILQYVVGLRDDFPVDSMSSPSTTTPRNYVLNLPSLTVKANDRIQVPIAIDDAGFTAGGISLKYDATILKAVGVTPQMLLNGSYWQANTDMDGEVRFAFASVEPTKEQGNLLMVEFEVLPNTEGRTSPLNFEKIDLSNSLTITKINGLVTVLTPDFALLQNYPNPFNPETWLPYQLAADANVIIRIYNQKGNLIKTLRLGKQNAGLYVNKDRAAYWNGKDDAGGEVASGVYFYTLRAGKTFSATRKMVIMK